MKRRRNTIPALPSEVDKGPSIRAANRTAESSEWRDPDDVARNVRTPRVIGGMRAADPLLRLSNNGTIDNRHMAAATKLRRDYEIGILGAHPGRSGVPDHIDGGGNGTPEEMRLAALGRFRAAMASIAGLGAAIICHVVIGQADGSHRDVTTFARSFGMEPKTATGLLIGALDRLAEHYLPVARPARTVSATMTDKRLGRWRVNEVAHNSP